MALYRAFPLRAARDVIRAVILFAITAVAPATLAAQSAPAAAPRQPQASFRAPGQTGHGPLRVLFIGNSYTYFNDLPSVIADLARGAGEARPLLAEQVLVGGATLESHLTRGDASRRIRAGSSAGPWDVVVLQEQSTRPLEDTAAMYRAVRALAAESRRVGAQPMLYETWARAVRPLAQDSLARAYRRIGQEVDAIVVPAGGAWALVRSADSSATRLLFVEDGSHPSPAGTYLAACTFYAALYGRSPVSLPSVSRLTTEQPAAGPPANAPLSRLPVELATRLQQAAWRAVRATAGAPAGR
jgi:hypothetical protein